MTPDELKHFDTITDECIAWITGDPEDVINATMEQRLQAVRVVLSIAQSRDACLKNLYGIIEGAIK